MNRNLLKRGLAAVGLLDFARTMNKAVLVSKPGPANKARSIINAIGSEPQLTSAKLMRDIEQLETLLRADTRQSKTIHTEIGKAIFKRSAKLYSGIGLPDQLRRFTYPAVISVALNSHCNAACFFCRDQDYKGASIDFDQIFKLDSAIKNARIVDLTGWGEPFFYPRFEEVVERICSINSSPHLIMVTTNGSFLSERWGKLLSGKISSLIVSMNAGSAENYAEQMRYKNQRFTFETTVSNIKEFCRHVTVEDRSRIVLHMVANTGNYRDMTPLVQLAREIGVPTVNIGNYICAQEDHLDKTLLHVKSDYNAELDRARAIGDRLGVHINARRFFTDEKTVKGADTCIAPFEQCFVEMPGSVAPCCFMGRARMGNVYEDGFEAVWFSEQFHKLRDARHLPACQVCTIFTPFDHEAAHISAYVTTKNIKHETAIDTMWSVKKPAREADPGS